MDDQIQKWDSNLESRFNGGRRDWEGNFNFQKVCIGKISRDRYGWQRIDKIVVS